MGNWIRIIAKYKKKEMEKGENVYAMNCLKRHSENHQVRIIDRICAGIMNKFKISNVW